jgi:hypothetical protein
MNNNNNHRIHLEVLELVLVAFQALKDFRINSNKVKEVELNLVIYLKNLKNFLEDNNKEKKDKCNKKGKILL